MTLRRSAALAYLLLIAGACATLPASQPSNPTPDITIMLASSPQRVHDQLLAAFPASGLPVTIAQPGVVEFHGARERGILGYDEVFARAVIEPVDCSTRVTLFGEQTHYENATATRGASARIGPSSTGRAADVWQKLQMVAQTLTRDSATVKAHC
jgi:hypothetical protein